LAANPSERPAAKRRRLESFGCVSDVPAWASRPRSDALVPDGFGGFNALGGATLSRLSAVAAVSAGESGVSS
ncbi:MAG: hypothetical protein IJO46_03775, partial [Thermoguttaceae bacterium]|nr:hypothetical protein [Thermoguttaceae bacterium]